MRHNGCRRNNEKGCGRNRRRLADATPVNVENNTEHSPRPGTERDLYGCENQGGHESHHQPRRQLPERELSSVSGQ